MPDPLPLDAEVVARIKAKLNRSHSWPAATVAALVATVEARDTQLADAHRERDALRELVNAQRSLTLLVENNGDPGVLVAAARRIEAAERALDREPQPGDGPDYHAEHQAWVERQTPGEVAALAAARATEGDSE